MKKKINIFFHHIREIKRNKILKYKLRFVVFSFIFLGILLTSIFAGIKSFSRYHSQANLSLDIQTAMFIVEPGEMSYNIDLEKILPSDEPYIYTFSISNFNEEKTTDVDLEYVIDIQTTTNLPLNYRLYVDSYNLNDNDIIATRELKQDEDNSWYNYFVVNQKKEFTYQRNETNIYYLVIEFPTNYKSVLEYSNAIENIQIIIKSKQII
jgi:hypothetical protein